MQLSPIQTIIILACIVGGTMITRLLPFVLFPENKEKPKLVSYLSTTVPAAMMGLLTVYCLRNVSFLTGNHALPEIIAIAIIVILHLWKRNVLVSIAVGTAAYMLLLHIL